MKPILIYIIISIFILFTTRSLSQTISGKVIDSITKEGIPFANVYINSSSLGVVTEIDGNFKLQAPDQPNKACELVVSFVGYQTQKITVQLTNGILQLGIIELVAKKEELDAIEIRAKRDVSWDKTYRKFKKVFLGDNYAEECEIVNPWELEFTTSKEATISASAGNPLQIQNNALGYTVFFDMTKFRSQGQAYLIEGHTRFQEQEPKDASQLMEWEARRETLYGRSRQHLMRSLVQHHLKGEGFKLYREKPGFENVTSRSAFFYQELGRFIQPLDTLSILTTTSEKGIYKLRFNGKIEVHYTKAFARKRTYNDIPHLVAWITLQDSLLVNEEGIELNPTNLIVSGYLSSERLASLLPVNYVPKSIQNTKTRASAGLNNRQPEHFYIQTDKPYYYPRETIWLKGYINYADGVRADSLSQIARAELLDSKGRVVQFKQLLIDSGLFSGSFTISDTISSGNYFLRAYTNFNRNFGDETLYIKYVPVLNIKTRVGQMTKPIDVTDTMGPLHIRFNKKVFGLRDLVVGNVNFDSDGTEIINANLSVSVTDAHQVAAIDLEPTIKAGFPVKPMLNLKSRLTWNYEIEHGINVSGQYFDSKGKGAKTTLNVTGIRPLNFTSTETSDDGRFSFHSGLFYDTASYSIKDSKNRAGRVVLSNYSVPSFRVPAVLPKIDTIAGSTVQRIFNTTDVNKTSTLLDELVVKGRQVRTGLTENYKSTMGRPDYVLPAKDINTSYGNLLFAIQGKFPGLIVRQVNTPAQSSQWQVYITRGLSLGNPKEVLVTINDAPTAGSPGATLSSINPETVESIEVTTRLNPLYGASSDFGGAFGVVAIYLKTGYANSSPLNDSRLKESLVKVIGLARPQAFANPDYSIPTKDNYVPDARATLYWNPNLTLTSQKSAQFRFYTSDMPGKYNVVIEGVLSNGHPVRTVYVIHID